MKHLKQVVAWLSTSSADPAQTSALIKGTLKIGAAQIIHLASTACTFGIGCAVGDLGWLNDAADLLGLVAFGILTVWGGAQALFGLLRKVQLGRWAHPDAVPQE